MDDVLLFVGLRFSGFCCECCLCFRFGLNMWSILCVTKKPPTTLIVAKVIAAKLSTVAIAFCSVALIAVIAPINVIPEIALEPDMSGVCRVGETLLISSTPKNRASTSRVNATIRSIFKSSGVGRMYPDAYRGQTRFG